MAEEVIICDECPSILQVFVTLIKFNQCTVRLKLRIYSPSAESYDIVYLAKLHIPIK